jgi:citrate synthase
MHSFPFERQRGFLFRFHVSHPGIDVDLLMPVFAESRIAGWSAHIIEHLDDNRLIRPRADYIGPIYPSKCVPMENQ